MGEQQCVWSGRTHSLTQSRIHTNTHAQAHTHSYVHTSTQTHTLCLSATLLLPPPQPEEQTVAFVLSFQLRYFADETSVAWRGVRWCGVAWRGRRCRPQHGHRAAGSVCVPPASGGHGEETSAHLRGG